MAEEILRTSLDNLTPEARAQVTGRTQIEPTFAEGEMSAHASGEKITPENALITGLIVHNPDGSKITVRMDEYDQYESFGGLFTHGPFDSVKTGSVAQLSNLDTSPDSFLHASTKQLRNAMYAAYQDFGATPRGTRFFTENAKQVHETAWISPLFSDDKQAGWQQHQMTGNAWNMDLSEQLQLITENHNGVAEHQKEATQSNNSKPDLLAQLMSEAHFGRSAASSAKLQQIIIANGDIHLANQQAFNEQIVL